MEGGALYLGYINKVTMILSKFYKNYVQKNMYELLIKGEKN